VAWRVEVVKTGYEEVDLAMFARHNSAAGRFVPFGWHLVNEHVKIGILVVVPD